MMMMTNTFTLDLTSSSHSVSVAAADQQTKEWLYSNKASFQTLLRKFWEWDSFWSPDDQVGVPQMVMNGDTGQLALAHADANRSERIWDTFSKENLPLFYRKLKRIGDSLHFFLSFLFTGNAKGVDVPFAWTLAGDLSSVYIVFMPSHIGSSHVN